MQEPVLELKKTKERISRLELVKLRAEQRTKRRIAQFLEDQKLKEMEEKLKKGEDVTVEPEEVKTSPKDKKG